MKYRMLIWLLVLSLSLAACSRPLAGTAKRDPIAIKPITTEPTAQAPDDANGAETPCNVPRGSWEKHSLNVFFQGEWGDLDYKLYLPPCYNESDDAYPLLVLLHGFYGSSATWQEFGLVENLDRMIASAELPPMIVAAPSLPDIFNPQLEENQRLLHNSFYQHLLKAYRVAPERQQHALGGYSMGATWAFYLAVARPDAWGALGLHSPDLRLEEINRLSTQVAAGDLRPRLWLDSGHSDAAFGAALSLHQTLEASDVEHFWQDGPGGHEEAYWRENLPNYLRWYAEDW